MNKIGKIYVTGSCGFIGSHLVEALVSREYEVTALCLYNSFGSFGWLEDCVSKNHKNLKVILGDVRDKQFLEHTMKGHDTVFHLASLIAIPYSYHAPQSYFDTNLYGAMNVAQSCLNNGIRRLIHTSTSEVYGTAKYVPIDEKHPIQGQSPYSASKIAADVLVDSYFRAFDLPVVTIRPFNTYGPRQSLRAVIPTVIAQILSGQTTLKLGNITPTRDFNFVDDTVNAFMTVGELEDEKIIGETFNAGSGKDISVESVVKMIANIIGADVTIQTDDTRIRPVLSEVERLLSNADKLKSLSNWKSNIDLEHGLSLSIDWMKKSKKRDGSLYYCI